MSSRRIFLFAQAGVLVALLHTTASNDPGQFDYYIWLSLAVALPATVFRALVTDHRDENDYRAADGFTGCFSYLATIAVFAFTFANRTIAGAAVFVAASIGCILLLRFGRRPST